jgi:hypothetical protein
MIYIKFISSLILLLTLVGCGTDDILGALEPDKKSPDFGTQRILDDSIYQASGFTYLNEQRSHAGMSKFYWRDDLAKSSENHSKYLTKNNEIGHYEDSGLIGYTGYSPNDRILDTLSYRPRMTGENVSSGNMNTQTSINTLFSAIYHRFGFLSYSFRDIGFARDSRDDYDYISAYTYNLSTPSISDEQKKNPKVVLWPYDGQQDSLTVFYEESPDPLPDYSRSGYPISVQFNPAKSGDIVWQSFKIFDKDGDELTNTRVLDKQSDPNSKFSSKEFALFPLDELASDAEYSVVFEYREDGGNVQKLSWSFSTR